MWDKTHILIGPTQGLANLIDLSKSVNYLS